MLKYLKWIKKEREPNNNDNDIEKHSPTPKEVKYTPMTTQPHDTQKVKKTKQTAKKDKKNKILKLYDDLSPEDRECVGLIKCFMRSGRFANDKLSKVIPNIWIYYEIKNTKKQRDLWNLAHFELMSSVHGLSRYSNGSSSIQQPDQIHPQGLFDFILDVHRFIYDYHHDNPLNIHTDDYMPEQNSDEQKDHNQEDEFKSMLDSDIENMTPSDNGSFYEDVRGNHKVQIVVVTQ
jgi:hypothetical protein